MSRHITRTFLITLFRTSVPGCATGVLCHVGHLLCLTIPQFPLLLRSQLSFRDKGTFKQSWDSALLGLALAYRPAPKLQLCSNQCGARDEGCGSDGSFQPSFAHTLPALAFLSASRRKWLFFVVDPAGDWYYHWLAVIAVPVLYNWCLLIAR